MREQVDKELLMILPTTVQKSATTYTRNVSAGVEGPSIGSTMALILEHGE